MALRTNATTRAGADQVLPLQPTEDLLREMLRGLVQETIQQEFESFMGAARYERGEGRRGGGTARSRAR
jgi:transposase-like protein